MSFRWKILTRTENEYLYEFSIEIFKALNFNQALRFVASFCTFHSVFIFLGVKAAGIKEKACPFFILREGHAFSFTIQLINPTSIHFKIVNFPFPIPRNRRITVKIHMKNQENEYFIQASFSTVYTLYR